MRKLMMCVLFPALIAVGTALTVSTPAQAAPPIREGYMTPGQLASLCTQMGGTFDDLGGGDSWCVLPDGRVMVCYNSIKICAWHYAMTPDTDWRDVTVPADLVLRNPPSPRQAAHIPANVRTVLSR
jgi:hypothetical protein